MNIHKELNQEFHQAITELVQEQVRSASSNSVAENIKYNHFIQEINVVRENGIWLKSNHLSRFTSYKLTQKLFSSNNF